MKCSRGHGATGIFIHYSWKCKIAQSLWKAIQQFLKKLTGSSHFILRYLPKENVSCIYIKTYASILIATLFIIAQNWKQFKCLSADE
jgi:hypothetical protein